MIPIDLQIKVIDYGFFTWNPKHYQVPWIKGRGLSIGRKGFAKCDKNRITLDEVRECLKLNQSPPKLRIIDETNRILANSPITFPKGARQNILSNQKPYHWTSAIPLYAAQQNGCNLKQIDFLLIGKQIFSTLYYRYHQKYRNEDYIMLEMKKGILMVRLCSGDASVRDLSDMNDVGHQYKRFIQDGKFNEMSDLIETRNVREICLGGHKVLVSAKVDCVDNNGDLVETKLRDFFQNSTRNESVEEKSAMNLLQTMITNGSVRAVLGNITWDQRKCTLNSVQSYSLEYVLDYVQCKTYNVEEFTEQLNTDNLFLPVIEILSELKNYIADGTISDKPNSYYKMTFKSTKQDGKKDIVIEQINMKGTVDYCSQYLYDALLEDQGVPKDLDSLATNCDSIVNSVNDEYKRCACEESASVKEVPKKWKRYCDSTSITRNLLKIQIAE